MAPYHGRLRSAYSCICADGSKGERRLAPMVQATTAREPHVRHQNIPEHRRDHEEYFSRLSV